MVPSFTNTLFVKYWPHGRYYNQLHALYRTWNVNTIGDILRLTEADIMRTPVCGSGTIRVLRQVVADAMKAYLEEVS